LLLAALAACAGGERSALQSSSTTTAPEDQLDGWVGHSFSDVVTRWGVPAQQQETPDGGLLVSFAYADEQVGDGSFSRLIGELGADEDWQALLNDEGQVRRQSCVVTFHFDATHRVRATAIVEDGGTVFSHCTGFVRPPPPGVPPADDAGTGPAARDAGAT
jgi:hypothetical protein